MLMSDLGLDCFDVAKRLARNQKPSVDSLSLAGCYLDKIGLHHLVMEKPSKQFNKLGVYCEKNQIPLCAINWEMPNVSDDILLMQHVDAFSTFVGSTHHHIDRYVVCMARTLVEASELQVSRITQRSGVIKHVKRLNQLASYYQTRILLVNDVNDGEVYLDDILSKIEVSRVYLP